MIGWYPYTTYMVRKANRGKKSAAANKQFQVFSMRKIEQKLVHKA